MAINLGEGCVEIYGECCTVLELELTADLTSEDIEHDLAWIYKLGT